MGPTSGNLANDNDCLGKLPQTDLLTYYFCLARSGSANGCEGDAMP